MSSLPVVLPHQVPATEVELGCGNEMPREFLLGWSFSSSVMHPRDKLGRS